MLIRQLFVLSILNLFALAATSFASPLTASTSFAGGVGFVATTFSLEVFIGNSPLPVPDRTVFQLTLDDSSEGMTFLATPATPNFSNFVDALTSNSWQFVQVVARFDGGFIGGGFGNSDFLDPSGNPASTAGLAIDSLSLHVDVFNNDIAGKEPPRQRKLDRCGTGLHVDY